MRLRSTLGYIVAGLIGLVIGYFGGREHLKYELRSAFQSVAGDIQKGFASSFGRPLTTPGTEKTTLPPPSTPKEPSPVEITLLTKGFKPSNPAAGDYEDDITLVLGIKNHSNQDIRAFDGTLMFTDLLNNKIISISLAINDPIAAGVSLNWNGGIKYNQFLDPHQRLRGAAQANLKVNFVPKKVLFSDGSVKEYNDQGDR